MFSFQGLREYKEKFDPVWEPRYLASPGGLRLPRILADVTTLINRKRRAYSKGTGFSMWHHSQEAGLQRQ